MMVVRIFQQTQPQFGQAMSDFLKESFARSNRPTVIQALMTGATAKYAEDIKYMTDVANKSVLSKANICYVLKLCAQLWPIARLIPPKRKIC
jgi:hypothetical protein